MSRHRSFPLQTSCQVCRSHSLNTAMGTPPPPKGAFSLHLVPLQGDSTPAPFPTVHLNGSPALQAARAAAEQGVLLGPA